jgi:YbbR domain-containing protein
MYAGKIKIILKKAGKDWSIMIISLLLATFMWCVQNFAKGYSTYFSYKVTLKTYMPGRTQKAVSKDVMVVRGKSSGYYILQKRYTNKSDEIEISLDPKMIKMMSGSPNEFYVRCDNIKDKIQEVLGNDFQIEWFTSDTLRFLFPRQYNKKVPVAVNSSLRFRSQYMQLGKLTVNPDSVVVFGEKSVIDTVDSVYTELIEGSDIVAPKQGIVSLVPIKNISFSQTDIAYSFVAVRYVESTMMVHVNVINIPEKTKVVPIPHNVTLRYRVPSVDKKSYSQSDFKVILNYEELVGLNQNVTKPHLVKSPKGVIWFDIEPKFIEYIIN